MSSKRSRVLLFWGEFTFCRSLSYCFIGCYRLVSDGRLSLFSSVPRSNIDKPDGSAILLHDFQRFLLFEQQVKSAP